MQQNNHIYYGVSREKKTVKVNILLAAISNREQYPGVTGVKKVIKGLCENGIPITFYNPYNLASCDSRNCFTEVISRTITYSVML